jgi:hypothetical protein
MPVEVSERDTCADRDGIERRGDIHGPSSTETVSEMDATESKIDRLYLKAKER